jgi:CubicO group peptidase (beta-lactamase class C family)
LASYLSSKFWAAYGLEQSAFWSLDRTDHEWAGCCLQATLRDYARYGQFVLEGARVNGRPIVPEGWFDAATKPQSDAAAGARNYGFQWWLGSDGTFDAIGIHGQAVHIDPKRRLVVGINSAWEVPSSGTRSAARTRMLNSIAVALDAEGK